MARQPCRVCTLRVTRVSRYPATCTAFTDEKAGVRAQLLAGAYLTSSLQAMQACCGCRVVLRVLHSQYSSWCVCCGRAGL